MARRFSIPETAERQTLIEIRDWHGGIVDALFDQRARVLDAIRSGLAASYRFLDMTEIEVDAHFDDQRRELDRLTVLNLVASVEATVVVDYFRRVHLKRKDPLALAYRKWREGLSRKKRNRPNFDKKGILDVLKATGLIDPNVIGQYRECLRTRHWVGHGRHWAMPLEVDQLALEDVTNVLMPCWGRCRPE